MKRNPTADSLSTWPMPNRDHIQGPIDAPMMLVEYGDYECPHCGEAYPVVKEIQKRMGNLVCFAFRNFPMVNAHPHAQHAAEAAEAAAAQGHFWEMHDRLYENQQALEMTILPASAMHLDASRLLREIVAGTHAPRVREDFRSGARHDVNGTPTFFVNGVRYDGETDVEELVAALTGKAALRTP